MRSLIATLFLVPLVATAESEVPVFAEVAGNAKVMLLIDDSGSMNANMEHPEFNPASGVATDPTKDIPAVIFRLNSGSSAPSTSHTLVPVLIEGNIGFNSSSTGNVYAGAALTSASSIPVVARMSCNNSSGSSVGCPSPGPSSPSSGPNAGYLFGNAATVGSAIFQVSNLAKTSGGTNVVDSSGNEYLYLGYRRNDYLRQDDWGDVWAKFDSSGNPLVVRTRVFATAGGTVVFNGRQVFLSAGWYRMEYLRWIFYAATPAQIASLPGITRLSTVKNTVTNLILSNPAVKFGLASLNGTSHSAGVHSGNLFTQWYTPSGNTNQGARPRVRQPVGTVSAALISSLNEMSPRGGTPLSNTYIETLRYYHGETDNDPYCQSCQYTSPITSGCDSHFVVVLTDGLPTTESENSLFGSAILDYDGDGDEAPLTSNQGCNSTTCPLFMDDAAYFARHNDFSTAVPNQQSITSYTIGLGIAYQLLDKVAEGGGSGRSYLANSVEEVNETLESIVSLIIASPIAGAGAALAETFGESGRVYRPRFRADTWMGNIDVFTYDTASQSLVFQFDMGDILEARTLGTSPRRIYAGVDPNHDGQTNQMVEFSTSNAALLRPEIFRHFATGVESPSLLEPPLADYTSDAAAASLIQFVHGEAIAGLRVRDRDGDGQVEKLGDIVYSRPVEVGPKNANYQLLTGYAAFTSSLASEPRILLVGANDGMLHAFDAESGEEMWAYIPSNLLPYLERQTRLFYNALYRRAMVDGLISVEDVYRNGGWRTLAMFGQRTGGTTFTILDITDRRNPVLVWEVSDGANGGESWSKPAVVLSVGPTATSDPGAFQWSMVVGTGEGKSDPGTAILSFNLGSSVPPAPTRLNLSTGDPAETRTSSVTAVQNDKDQNVDRLYVGTEEGDLFRVEVRGAPSSWTATRVFDGSSTQPIVAAPVAVLADNPLSGSSSSAKPLAVGLYWGTGRYDVRSDITSVGTVPQRIYGLFDPVDIAADDYAGALADIGVVALQNQSVSSFNVRRDSDGVYRVPAGKAGFYLDLDNSLAAPASGFLNPTGMVVSEAANIRGALLFATFLPNQGQCAVGGYGFIQGVNFRTGGGMVVDYSVDAHRPFYNGGVPDLDGDGSVDGEDLEMGIGDGRLLPALDSHIERIDLTLTNPYIHDGLLRQDDVRLHSTNGGILPSVSSLGDRGVPVAPTILRGGPKIVVQPAYPVPPEVGNPGGGSGGSGGGAEPVPPPDLLPITVYTLPLDIISFHETTGE